MRESLSTSAYEAFVFLTECEYSLGIINNADLEERELILKWLTEKSGAKDPRHRNTIISKNENDIPCEVFVTNENDDESSYLDTYAGQKSHEEPEVLHLIPGGLKDKWCFTIGDPDNYPSVPHGHLNSKDQPWPKLNPYSGRAFDSKDIENLKYRLDHTKMVTLWNNKKFREHALKQIAFYQVNHPHYRFPVALHRIRKLPKW